MVKEYIKWTDEEKKLLIKLKEVDKLKFKDMLPYFEDRTEQQLRSKYRNETVRLKNLATKQDNKNKITRAPWSEHDEQLLLENYDKDWDYLQEMFPDRTLIAIKRKITTMRKNRKKIALTEEHKQYIHKNYKAMTTREMSEALGVNISTMTSYMNRENLKSANLAWFAESIELDEGTFSVTVNFIKDEVDRDDDK